MLVTKAHCFRQGRAGFTVGRVRLVRLRARVEHPWVTQRREQEETASERQLLQLGLEVRSET